MRARNGAGRVKAFVTISYLIHLIEHIPIQSLFYPNNLGTFTFMVQ